MHVRSSRRCFEYGIDFVESNVKKNRQNAQISDQFNVESRKDIEWEFIVNRKRLSEF